MGADLSSLGRYACTAHSHSIQLNLVSTKCGGHSKIAKSQISKTQINKTQISKSQISTSQISKSHIIKSQIAKSQHKF